MLFIDEITHIKTGYTSKRTLLTDSDSYTFSLVNEKGDFVKEVYRRELEILVKRGIVKCITQDVDSNVLAVYSITPTEYKIAKYIDFLARFEDDIKVPYLSADFVANEGSVVCLKFDHYPIMSIVLGVDLPLCDDGVFYIKVKSGVFYKYRLTNLALISRLRVTGKDLRDVVFI